MADVARAAGVALDTIYASIGPKQQLFRLLLETALSGTYDAVPANKRRYVQAIRAEPSPRQKLVLYARALCEIHERLAPLVAVLREAAPADKQLKALWKGIAERRAGNMRVFASELAETGYLRAELGVAEAADVLWATNAPEFYLLLVQERGWKPARFASWLASSWARLLLVDDAP
jgi:AcrR family transcriptional regulator